MKLNKIQENKVAKAAKLIRKALREMTPDESVEFILSEASGSTLRQLQFLQSAIEEWGFKRTGD